MYHGSLIGAEHTVISFNGINSQCGKFACRTFQIGAFISFPAHRMSPDRYAACGMDGVDRSGRFRQAAGDICRTVFAQKFFKDLPRVGKAVAVDQCGGEVRSADTIQRQIGKFRHIQRQFVS